MALMDKTKKLNRQFMLIKSTLRSSLNMDVSSTRTGMLLKDKGYIGEKGKITKKGKLALNILK